MKTTLEIDDALYREAKAMAALTGRRMKDLVSEGLRLLMREGPATAVREPMPRMKLPLVPSWPTKGKVTSERIYQMETEADLDRL